MKKEQLIRIFLYFWLVGAFVSFVIQFFFSASVAGLSLWKYSSGWQGEIAFWNVGIIFAILYALKIKKLEILIFLALVLVIISLILGTNHFAAILISQKITLINVLGLFLNYFAVVFGFYAIKINKKDNVIMKS